MVVEKLKISIAQHLMTKPNGSFLIVRKSSLLNQSILRYHLMRNMIWSWARHVLPHPLCTATNIRTSDLAIWELQLIYYRSLSLPSSSRTGIYELVIIDIILLNGLDFSPP